MSSAPTTSDGPTRTSVRSSDFPGGWMVTTDRPKHVAFLGPEPVVDDGLNRRPSLALLPSLDRNGWKVVGFATYGTPAPVFVDAVAFTDAVAVAAEEMRRLDDGGQPSEADTDVYAEAASSALVTGEADEENNDEAERQSRLEDWR